MLPTQYDIYEYGIIEEFAEGISDIKLKNQLYIVLNGKGDKENILIIKVEKCYH